MTNKEKYIEYTKNTFDGKAKELVLKQIDLFYKDTHSLYTIILQSFKLFLKFFLSTAQKRQPAQNCHRFFQ